MYRRKITKIYSLLFIETKHFQVSFKMYPVLESAAVSRSEEIS